MTLSLDGFNWTTHGPALAAVGTALLVLWGMRGRRVDDHPLCRRCGFDLFGRAEGTTNCSECGADLRRRRAIRIGHRVRRRRVIGAATPVLLAAVGWLGVVGWGRAKGVDWNQHKPFWLLEREAGGVDVAARDVAIAELARRLVDGKLEPQREQALEDAALALQADLKRPWAPAWGELLEASRNAGQLSNEQWDRYIAQSVCLSLEARPMVRRGDPLPVRIRWGPPRAGKAVFALDVALEPEVKIGEETAVMYDQGANKFRRFQVAPGATATNVFAEGVCYLKPELLGKLADGSHTVNVAARVISRTPVVRAARAGGRASKIELEAKWELVPADRPTVRVTADLGHREAVEAALKMYGVEYSVGPQQPGRMTGYLDGNRPPVLLCYDAYVRVGFSRLPFGPVLLSPQGQGGRFPMATVVPGPPMEATTVDVVLEPSAERATRTVDVFEIWGEPVVFKGVKVRFVENAGQYPARAAGGR